MKTINDYLMRAGLPYRLFVYITALLIGFGFVMPAKPLHALGLLWSFYVVGFAMAHVANRGLIRGLATPTAALVIATCLNPTA